MNERLINHQSLMKSLGTSKISKLLDNIHRYLHALNFNIISIRNIIFEKERQNSAL